MRLNYDSCLIIDTYFVGTEANRNMVAIPPKKSGTSEIIYGILIREGGDYLWEWVQLGIVTNYWVKELKNCTFFHSFTNNKKDFGEPVLNICT